MMKRNFQEIRNLLTPISPLFSQKQILREKLKAERRAAAKARPDAAKHAARIFLDHIGIPPGAVVSLYHPLKDELDTEPLALALVERGAALALPVVTAKKAPLDFRLFTHGDALLKGVHGSLEPERTAPGAEPDIVVTPLLGFTRGGGRLGLGGGYYDRTLAALRARRPVVAIGYAYGAQEVDALPLSPLDQRLDWIVTEREAIRVS